MGIFAVIRGLSGRKIESAGFTRSRASRHTDVDLKALAKRRAKNKAATRSRRINRLRSAR